MVAELDVFKNSVHYPVLTATFPSFRCTLPVDGDLYAGVPMFCSLNFVH